MRRGIVVFLLLCLLLPGCGSSQETARFYYLRQEPVNGQEDGVLAYEERDVSGHAQDVSYLLSLYLMGPSQEGLASAVPRGTVVQAVEQTPQGLRLTLSDGLGALGDREFALACACLTLTCQELTGAQQVKIISADRSMTMSPQSILLYDSLTIEPTEETQ